MKDEAVKRWRDSVRESVAQGDAVAPPLPAPIEDLSIELRGGLELDEGEALALLDEIQRLKGIKLARLEAGAEACARLRSALDAACLPGGMDPSLPHQLRATLAPLEDEILSLGAIQRSVRIHEGAIGLVITTPEGAAPLDPCQVRALTTALRLSGAPEGFALIVVPAGFGARAESNVEDFPAVNAVRFLEPGPAPDGFSEEASDLW